MQSPLIYISLALAIGVAVGTIIQIDSKSLDTTATPLSQNTAAMPGEGNSTDNLNPAHFVENITELKRLLKYETSARQALELKVEKLSHQVAAFDSRSQLPEKIENRGKSDVSSPEKNWFNEQALIDGGMGSSQASDLKLFFEKLELDGLYLRDQSIRESWSREKYREEMQTLASKEDELKGQLSESTYDSYLFASGRPNRVAVTSVFASAQAGIAGVVPGDHIIRYDNQRIYNGFDLQEATTSGNISDTVALEVEREGETIQFYLARGPLGIRMNSVSVAP
jgi:hypothetical protein